MTLKIRSTCARIGMSFGGASEGGGTGGFAAIRTLRAQPLRPVMETPARKSRRFTRHLAELVWRVQVRLIMAPIPVANNVADNILPNNCGAGFIQPGVSQLAGKKDIGHPVGKFFGVGIVDCLPSQIACPA